MKYTLTQNRAAILLILLLGLLAVITGCGGAGGSNASGTGSATLSITWPTRSRLIPAASNSIRIVFTQNGAIISNTVVPRPAAGGTSNVIINNLKVGALVMTATAYPNADGTGEAQATGSSQITIADNQTTNVTLTMNSTIDHLGISPPSVDTIMGSTVQLTVSARDLANGIVLTTPSKITYVPSTSAVTVDPDGLLHAAAVGSGSITITETESGKQVVVPYNVTPVTPGNVVMYVADNNYPSSYNTDLVLLKHFSNDIIRPSGVAVDSAGNLYVGEGADIHGGSGDKIWKFASSGTNLGVFATVPGPFSLRFDSAGNLLVLSQSGGIYKVSPNGVTVTPLTPPGKFLRDIVLDTAGNIYATSIENTNNVLKFAPDGTPMGVFASVDGSPAGLTFDAAGTLYVSVYGGTSSGTVQKFNSAGQNTGTFATGLNGPWGMALDPSGNLYVAEAANSGISKFSSAGALVKKINLVVDTARNITFGPAPPP